MERDTELLRCLALVRPVGMSDDMASDWLTSALFEVRAMDERQFRAGCQHARATCTHHAQIIPAIMQGSAEAAKPDFATQYIKRWNRALKDYSEGYPALTNSSSCPKRLGQVIKLPRPE
jgi:hypothetical protein